MGGRCRSLESPFVNIFGSDVRSGAGKEPDDSR